MKEEKIYEIPKEGSLGILALGSVGVKAWRKERDQQNVENEEDDEG